MWGGVLMVAGYATGAPYERNQKTLREVQDGCGGMLPSLQNFRANQKYSEAHAYHLSMCSYADRRRGCPGRGRHRRHSHVGFAFQYEGSGTTNEVLCKVAQVSQENMHLPIQNRGKPNRKMPR
jgi:hypothetical protein